MNFGNNWKNALPSARGRDGIYEKITAWLFVTKCAAIKFVKPWMSSHISPESKATLVRPYVQNVPGKIDEASPAVVIDPWDRGGLRLYRAPGWNLERAPFYIYIRKTEWTNWSTCSIEKNEAWAKKRIINLCKSQYERNSWISQTI